MIREIEPLTSFISYISFDELNKKAHVLQAVQLYIVTFINTYGYTSWRLNDAQVAGMLSSTLTLKTQYGAYINAVKKNHLENQAELKKLIAMMTSHMNGQLKYSLIDQSGLWSVRFLEENKYDSYSQICSD